MDMQRGKDWNYTTTSLPEAENLKGRYPSEDLGRAWSSQHHDLASRTVKGHISIVLSHPVFSTLENYGSPRELIEAPMYKLSQFLCSQETTLSPVHSWCSPICQLLLEEFSQITLLSGVSIYFSKPMFMSHSFLQIPFSPQIFQQLFALLSNLFYGFKNSNNLCSLFGIFFFSVENVLFTDPHILKQKPEGMNLIFCWFSFHSVQYIL